MQEQPPWIRPGAGGLQLFVRVQPGARRSAVAGLHGERLKIAVQAPPLDGRANEALVEFLAGCLRLRKADLAIEAGAASRDKRIAIRCEPGQAQEITQRLIVLIQALR